MEGYPLAKCQGAIMSRSKTEKLECGCEIITEPTGREVWGALCVAHDEETKALHAEARRAHQQERMRALEEEFT
jgi:hypothetical protein